MATDAVSLLMQDAFVEDAVLANDITRKRPPICFLCRVVDHPAPVKYVQLQWGEEDGKIRR